MNREPAVQESALADRLSGLNNFPCPFHPGAHLVIGRTGSAGFCRGGDYSIVPKCDLATLREYAAKLNGHTLTSQIRFRIADSNGAVVAVHVREDWPEGKRMWWEQPNGDKGLNGSSVADLPLYGTERLAVDAQEVVLVEGEKAAEALIKRGVCAALGTVTGASSCPSTASLRVLAGRIAILWPDNDEIGRRHMQTVAERLSALGITAHLLSWTEAPPHGDAADYEGPNDGIVDLITSAMMQPPILLPGARNGTVSTISDCRAPVSSWDRAISVPDLLNSESPDIEWLARDFLAPGSVTVMASPRGIGKTHLAHDVAVAKATGGIFRGERLSAGRVLLLDRDNSRREVKRRLRAWGGAAAKTLKVLTRDEVPPLTDSKAWAQFPFGDYDLVILDSLSAATEGVKEADEGASGLAIAPLLDLARRGPAVLLLANTRKDGEVLRGSGVIGDRADIVYEVRDATEMTLDAKREVWWECLPASNEAAWSSKAKRRRRRNEYRLALVPSKFRIGEEPNPWAIEISLDDDGENTWTLRDVTVETESELERTRGEVDLAKKAAVDAHIAALQLALPLARTEAEKLLMARGASKRASRQILAEGIGLHWTREGTGKRSDPITYRILTEENVARKREAPDPTEPVTSDAPIPATIMAQGWPESTDKNDSPTVTLNTRNADHDFSRADANCSHGGDRWHCEECEIERLARADEEEKEPL